jgi:hypothetical protein
MMLLRIGKAEAFQLGGGLERGSSAVVIWTSERWCVKNFDTHAGILHRYHAPRSSLLARYLGRHIISLR